MTYEVPHRVSEIREQVQANQQMLGIAENFADIIESAGAENVTLQVSRKSHRIDRRAKIRIRGNLKTAADVEAMGQILAYDGVKNEAMYECDKYNVAWAKWESQ
jgi:hypothetical protein